MMPNHEIIRLKPEDYHKCSNIWDMEKHPERSKRFYDSLVSGNRLVWIYAIGGEFIGEAALVVQNNDPDYTIPGRRIYFSHFVVKDGYRNQGIGSALMDYVIGEAAKMGYSEISVGVDKKNTGAFRLYQRKGFDEIIFEGEDEAGPCYKLLKKEGQ